MSVSSSSSKSWKKNTSSCNGLITNVTIIHFLCFNCSKRVQKEIICLIKEPPEGMHINQETLQEQDMSTLVVEMAGPKGTLYEGENFQLEFKFNSKYPFDSPQVVFVGNAIPIHPHIYSNGHICLSILTDDWSPAMSIRSVCLSVMSVLASASEKKPPPDDLDYVRKCSRNPKETLWLYHDDNV
ncbi:ubiquitin-conjugating enzyme E2 W isoform X1 [Lepeophtheirus salmonis]|uniref:ubiquitin-conjugating enzyme E2 W isoform X1 n=1 Tax=Lepeophtheirus salmonis TaxID=72036 RepID=UPI001AE25382|nr:ubiquitin-conjugating enzyme E2 W-like isoform X1 [Lepeophtheirus salmonis]